MTWHSSSLVSAPWDSGLELLGFSERDVQKLLATLESNIGLTDPYEVPEPPETPITQTGDLWLLGDHRSSVATPRTHTMCRS